MSDKLPCPKCNGSGKRAPLSSKECLVCDGAGKVSNEQYTILTNQSRNGAIVFVVVMVFFLLGFLLLLNWAV